MNIVPAAVEVVYPAWYPEIIPSAVMEPLVRVPIRRWRLHFSITAQIDGLLFSLLGVRLDRDVLAPSASTAQCPFYGRGQWESCSSFCGLYVSDGATVAKAIVVAARHHGCGVFVVPTGSHAALGLAQDSEAAGWFGQLMAKSRLVFRLPADAFIDTMGGIAHQATGWIAVFACFDVCRRFKSKRRPETKFEMKVIPIIGGAPMMIGTLPALQSRVSPMADELGPKAADDIIADNGELLYGSGPRPKCIAK